MGITQNLIYNCCQNSFLGEANLSEHIHKYILTSIHQHKSIIYIVTRYENVNQEHKPQNRKFKLKRIPAQLHITINCYYQNVCGLRAKTIKFYNQIHLLDVHIIVLTETWLSVDINSSEIFDNHFIACNFAEQAKLQDI